MCVACLLPFLQVQFPLLGSAALETQSIKTKHTCCVHIGNLYRALCLHLKQKMKGTFVKM